MAYNVKFLKGTFESYNALASKDPNTFYYLDNANLYLGSIKLSDGPELAAAIERIAAVEGVNETQNTEIANIKKELAALGGSEGGTITDMINDAVAILENKLQPQITQNKTDIATEKSRAEGIEAGLRSDIDTVSGNLSTLQQIVTDNETDIEKKVSDLGDEIDTVAGNLETLAGRVSTAEGDIDSLEGRMDAVEDLAEGNDAKIDTLIGSDTDKSVRTIANEELAAQLIAPGADESLNTLQEIAQWIQDHPGDASEMNLAIAANSDAIDAINHETTGILAQAKKYTDDEVKEVQDQVDAINNETSGILAQAKGYTDTEVGKVNSALNTYKEENNEAVSGVSTVANRADAQAAENKTSIANLTTTVGQNKTDAETALTNAINTLKTSYKLDSLGTAAYKAVEDFDAAGAAEDALNSAKSYVDAALTWAPIA